MAEFLTLVVSLFAVINPVASIPVFLTFFGKSKPEYQARAALHVTAAAAVLLFLFALFGPALLVALGVSVPAFMIAGGILLLLLSFDFLLGEHPRSRTVEHDTADAVVPIGTPLLAGPGALSTSIYFTQTSGFGPTLGSILVVMTIAFILLMYSRKITSYMGKNGVKMFTRIMGLITAAIAISLVERALVLYGVLHPIF